MNGDGIVTVLYNFGDAVTTSTSGVQHDVCKSVAYDYNRQEIAYMLESTSESLRPNFRNYNTYSEKNNDLTVVMMSPGGVLTGAFNLNYWDAAVSIGIGGQSFFIKGEDYIFGSQSQGYKTKYQNVIPSATDPQLDTSIFKWNPRGGVDCFYTADMSSRTIQEAVFDEPTGVNSMNGYTDAQITERAQEFNLLKAKQFVLGLSIKILWIIRSRRHYEVPKDVRIQLSQHDRGYPILQRSERDSIHHWTAIFCCWCPCSNG